MVKRMNKRPRYPVVCLILGGALSVLVLYFLSTVGNRHRLLLPTAGAAFVLLVLVLVKGDAWQKMVAGALLFVPSFGLVMTVMD